MSNLLSLFFILLASYLMFMLESYTFENLMVNTEHNTNWLNRKLYNDFNLKIG